MKTETYPLAMPKDLLERVRRTAKVTGLSLADAMRQSMKLGLPRLEEQLSTGKIEPMTPAECRECWATPDPEFDPIATHCASLPKPPPEE